MVRRKKFSEDEIATILKSVEEGADIAVVASKIGVTEQTIARWRASNSRLAETQLEELRLLQSENQRLKRIVARQALEIDAYREITDETW